MHFPLMSIKIDSDVKICLMRINVTPYSYPAGKHLSAVAEAFLEHLLERKAG